jgi:hypothetical protein
VGAGFQPVAFSCSRPHGLEGYATGIRILREANSERQSAIENRHSPMPGAVKAVPALP